MIVAIVANVKNKVLIFRKTYTLHWVIVVDLYSASKNHVLEGGLDKWVIKFLCRMK